MRLFLYAYARLPRESPQKGLARRPCINSHTTFPSFESSINTTTPPQRHVLQVVLHVTILGIAGSKPISLTVPGVLPHFFLKNHRTLAPGLSNLPTFDHRAAGVTRSRSIATELLSRNSHHDGGVVHAPLPRQSSPQWYAKPDHLYRSIWESIRSGSQTISSQVSIRDLGSLWIRDISPSRR